ncbi:MAG: SMC-Scp complex subunit ScpB [Candidatus Taylorbacteria bacterium RIFCSPHIGHO2_01_FULL_46_22b]|uniref:SMC-Scp complex subunit ScpB n=1 Tax=Candidatus Taylorbacteria bacterium RIFCSPHIGHO2_01_FULL_46_22b TaxID=1802301 RepID=A0A1G2M179_9BACT|nr:MAG: SMC-Scp complex subunit ScpB [Candidatus Taylorbacteria bacterium RIFCSPHIGHO2_01_FULL_46_22b]
MESLAKKIEAVLFWRAEPISKKKLAELLDSNITAVEEGLAELETALASRGITLVKKEDEVMLGTAPEFSPLIEKLTKEELHKDLGKAGLETLSIILYFGPVSRSEIDYIRGVNSTFVLRNLLIRGLVERVQNKNDQRSFLYKPTFELITFLGLKGVSELPEYETARAELDQFKNAQQEQDAVASNQESEQIQA